LSIFQLHILLSRTAQIYLELHTKKSPAAYTSGRQSDSCQRSSRTAERTKSLYY